MSRLLEIFQEALGNRRAEIESSPYWTCARCGTVVRDEMLHFVSVPIRGSLSVGTPAGADCAVCFTTQQRNHAPGLPKLLS